MADLSTNLNNNQFQTLLNLATTGALDQFQLITGASTGAILTCLDNTGLGQWSSESLIGVRSVTGTANQVLVNGTYGVQTKGDITLTLPQSIATSSSPTFTGLTLSGLTNSVLSASSTGILEALSIGNGLSFGSNTLAALINSTNLKFTSGMINTIQDIATTSSPQFTGLSLSGLTANEILYLAGSSVSSLTTSSPLSLSAGNLGLLYNGTNLRLTSSALNTIQDIATTSSPTFSALTTTNNITAGGNLTVSGSAIISGNLTVNGTTTTVNSTTVSVESNFLQLTNMNNSTNSLDIGIFGEYYSAGALRYTGLFYKSSNMGYQLFENLTVIPGSTVSTTDSSYQLAALSLGNLTAYNATLNSLTVSGLTNSIVSTSSAGLLEALTIGNGLSFGSNTLTTAINSTNLIYSSGVINTIQNIATTASPTFTSVTLSGLTANTPVYANSSKVLTSGSYGNGLSFSGGNLTTNIDGVDLIYSGSTITTAQGITTGSSPTFNYLTLSGLASYNSLVCSSGGELYNASIGLNLQYSGGVISTVSSPTFSNMVLTGTLGVNGISTFSAFTEFDGGQMYLNNSAENIILFNASGVAAPIAGRSTGTKIVLAPSGGPDYAIGIESSAMWFSNYNAASAFKWYGGTSAMMTLTNGQLGIGTTSPAYTLDVYSAANPASATTVDLARFYAGSAASGTTYTRVNIVSSTYGGYISGFITQGVGAGLTLGRNNSGTYTEAIRIDTTNYVGIGTTAPATTLQVNGVCSASSFACYSGTTASTNTIVGYQSGGNLNASSGDNIIVGYQSMYYNQTGIQNIAIGDLALYGVSNNSYNYNIAIGNKSMYSNTTGQYNIALGINTLGSNATGSNNVVIGANVQNGNASTSYNSIFGSAAAHVSTASYNCIFGYAAEYLCTSANSLCVMGHEAGYSNSTGNNNTVIGFEADYWNQTGGNNVALGYEALYGVSGYSHSGNTALGYESLLNILTGGNNVAVGISTGAALTTGSNNVIIGNTANVNAASASNRIAIGYNTTANADNSCYIGNIYTSTTAANAVNLVTIDSSNRLGSLQPNYLLGNYINLYTIASQTVSGGGGVNLLAESITFPSWGISWRLFVSYYIMLDQPAGAGYNTVQTCCSISSSSFAFATILCPNSDGIGINGAGISNANYAPGASATLTLAMYPISGNVNILYNYGITISSMQVIAIQMS